MRSSCFVQSTCALAALFALATTACGITSDDPASGEEPIAEPTSDAMSASLPTRRRHGHRYAWGRHTSWSWRNAGSPAPAATDTSEPPAPPPTATTPTPPPTSTSPASPPPTATTPTSPPTPPPTATAPTPSPAVRYHGINLSGAEFGSALPGRDGYDYEFPTTAEVDYYMAKGMNTFRIPFRWERVQPTALGGFASAYFSKLDALVTYATSRGAYVVLDPQNFARYYGNTIGSSQVPNSYFADLWGRLAQEYGSNTLVMFNLVNEPHDISTEQWVSAANAAIAAIRKQGAVNTIQVPGNGWTGAHAWTSSYYGTPNAVAMLDISDPGNNVLFEVHQYLDSDSGGGSASCVSSTIGSERLAGFIKWLRDHGKKGFLGEFAAGDNATCKTAVTDMLRALNDAGDVMTGWLWWGGGPGWGDYIFTLEPSGGKDRPQMAWLTPFL